MKTKIIYKSRRFNATEIRKKRRPWYDALIKASAKRVKI